MRKLATITALALVATMAHAGTAFLRGERISGMNKICYYEYLGSEVAITLRSYKLCPLSIRVE